MHKYLIAFSYTDSEGKQLIDSLLYIMTTIKTDNDLLVIRDRIQKEKQLENVYVLSFSKLW